MELLRHNEITYNELKLHIDSNRDCCIVNPCGSGKSTVIDKLIKEYPSKKFLIVTKQKGAIHYYYSDDKDFKKNNIPIITYNKLYNLYRQADLANYKNIDICIFDEAHYVGAQKWKDAVEYIRKETGCLCVGLTATVKRFDEQLTDLDILRYFGNNSVGNFTNSKLQQSGVFIEPEYIISLASVEEDIQKRLNNIQVSDLGDTEKLKFIQKLNSIRDTWRNKYHPSIIFKNKLPQYLYKENGNKIVVFSSNKTSSEKDQAFILGMLKQQFPDKKIGVHTFFYTDSNENLKKFEEDTDNYINVMFTINKFNESIHISDLSILIFLRSSISNVIITQQIGRLNDINSKNKGLIIDMVDNLGNYEKVASNSNTLGTIGRNTGKEYQNNNVKINNYYIREIHNLFSSIDSKTKVEYFIYNGVQATLRQLCFIFNIDFEKAHNYIYELGYDIDDAMIKSKNINSVPIKNDLHRLDTNVELTDKDRETVCKYYDYVQRCADNYKCNDEEIISELYLYLCYLSYYVNRHKVNMYESTYIQNNINRYLLRLLRRKYTSEEVIYINNNMKYDNLIRSNMEDLRGCLNVLNDRDKRVVEMYHGFNGNAPMYMSEISKELNITVNRVSQILKKSNHILGNFIRYHRKSIYENLDEYLVDFARLYNNNGFNSTNEDCVSYIIT